MSKLFLKMFSVNTLIEIVIDLLASTVKNPDSSKALRLRSVVYSLYRATRQFLQHTGGLPED